MRSKTRISRSATPRAKKPSDKMRRYRARLRAAGLRPVQIWVPDIHAPGFIKEARRQSLSASRSASDREAIDFIEAVGDFNGWK